MSAQQDSSGAINPDRDDQDAKGLNASRWAQDPVEDQKMVTQPMTKVQPKPATKSLANSCWAPGETSSQQAGTRQMATQDNTDTQASSNSNTASELTTGSLANSRWVGCRAAVVPDQTPNKPTQFQLKSGPSLSPKSSPSQAPEECKTTLPTNEPKPTTRRIIGDLTDEEKEFKMENPFS